MASNIESVRAWLRKCPVLDKSNAFRIDYIGDDPTCYAIFSAPSALAFKRNILGDARLSQIQTANFYFGVSCAFGADVATNAQNISELESMIEWINVQNITKIFPAIDEGVVLAIMPTLTPYPMNISRDAAQYRVSIQMTYRRKQ